MILCSGILLHSLTGVPAGSFPHVLRFLGALDDRLLDREEDRLDLLRCL